jgi:hypothetical protein
MPPPCLPNEHTTCDDTMDWLSNCFAKHVPLHDKEMVEGQGASATPVSCHWYTKMILCLRGSPLIRVIPPSDWLVMSSNSIDVATDYGFPISIGHELPRDCNLFGLGHVAATTGPTSIWHQPDATTTSSTTTTTAFGPKWFHPNFAVPDNPPSRSAILEPGCVVVIPPGWWYQTYQSCNNQVSVSVHSQRCGGSDMGYKLIQHMIQQAGATRTYHLNDLIYGGDEFEYYFTKQEAQQAVDEMFVELKEHYDNLEEDDDDDDDDDDDASRQNRSPEKNRQER